MKQIFPKEIIEHTTQYFIPKNTVKSKIVYGLILLLLICAFALLPIMSITIFTSARGQIKPNKDRLSLTSINSGKVIFNAIDNNKTVTSGDTLLILQTNILDDQLRLNSRKIKVIKEEIEDLKQILVNKKNKVSLVKTPKYQKELIQFNSRLSEHYTKIKKLKVDFERNKKLLSKGVIAQVEYENSKLEFDLANNLLLQFKKGKINNWQASLTELQNSLIDFENNIEQVKNNKKDFTITAPISGTLINTSSLSHGSFLNAGILLAEITPSTELIAECYVSPKDIGLIDKSKDVSFQIDAFNYNQWGFATGKIKNIGNDVEYIENKPFYKIQCKLNQKQLQLKNGYQRAIGKGMTFNARFEITERTLYELLYDKMDDWLNPGNNKNVALN